MGTPENIIAILKDSSELFRICAKKLRILSLISWNGKVLADFQNQKEEKLPQVNYAIDKNLILQLQGDLKAFKPRLAHKHPVYEWLEKTRASYELATYLLLNLESDTFFELSTQLYGNASTRLFDCGLTHLELANQLWTRLSICLLKPELQSSNHITAENFATLLEGKIEKRDPRLNIRIEVSNDLVAKAAAGLDRVRVRKGAMFSSMEVESLWNHEVETHALTAQNGLAQTNCDFLSAAGPRTTMTQEGLAVFFELYGHTMTQNRFVALCDRIHAIQKVQEGADFIETYRWFSERLLNKEEAFWATSRVFRGAKLTGSKPFTKDVVYIGGLLSVFSFLQLAVKNQNYHLIESLICGRIALEDAPVISWLRDQKILSEPRYVPFWLKQWEGLLSFFTLTSFLNAVDLASVQQYFSKIHLFDEWDFQ